MSCQNNFSHEAFWEKVQQVAMKAGQEVIEKVLVLYYCLTDPNTSPTAKTAIVGTLLYFVLPLDVVPDVAPVVGFIDDLAVLAVTFTAVFDEIKEEHWEKARAKMKEWFGDDDEPPQDTTRPL